MNVTNQQSDVAEIAKKSALIADKIIAETAGLREEIQAGRPNCSTESTVSGTLSAFKLLIAGMPSPRA